MKKQEVRATFHMLQFAVAYFVMLLAMYYNGSILLAICVGAWFGSFVFSWETISLRYAASQ
jgi:copper transporter 1